MNKKISTTFAIIVILLAGGLLAFLFVQEINQESKKESVPVNKVNPKVEKNNNARIANPASEYCIKNRGKSEIKTNEDGSQTGYCKFENGRECEEWSYFRGDCGKIDISDWNTYKNIKLGYEFKLPNDWFIDDKIIGKVVISSSAEKDFPFLEIIAVPVSKEYNIDNLIKKYLPDEVRSGRTIQKEEIIIDGETGYSVMDCGKFECVSQKWAIVRNGNFYFLNSKKGLMKEFEQIFNTFKFLQ
jgi:putative hemolysin